MHTMACMGQMCNSRLVLDPILPEIDHSVFKKCDWTEFYLEAKWLYPSMPKNPEGRKLITACLWKVIMQKTRYLADQEKGFLIYVNTALVHWYSKK